MIYSRIAGVGDYLPERKLTNADLEKMVDTNDAWITERTGIKSRRIAGNADTTSSMGLSASRKAIAQAGLSVNDIDMIVVATCTPDLMFPSTACLIQAGLDMDKTIPAFDVSAACAGFIYALSCADQFIRSGQVKHALVVGAETLSRTVDWTDRSTCVLFGDGAGAVVLSSAAEPGVLSTHMRANGKYRDMLYLGNRTLEDSPEIGAERRWLAMQGGDVFKVAVTELGNIAEEALAANDLSKADLDWLVPHQANQRIIQAVAKRMGLSMDNVILTVAEHGNTSAASIPLALAQGVADGRIQPGHHILLDAIGGGMTWGAALIKWG